MGKIYLKIAVAACFVLCASFLQAQNFNDTIQVKFSGIEYNCDADSLFADVVVLNTSQNNISLGGFTGRFEYNSSLMGVPNLEQTYLSGAHLISSTTTINNELVWTYTFYQIDLTGVIPNDGNWHEVARVGFEVYEPDSCLMINWRMPGQNPPPFSVAIENEDNGGFFNTSYSLWIEDMYSLVYYPDTACTNTTTDYDTIVISTCGQYICPFSMDTVFATGIYYDTLSTPGSDSILVIDLTVNSCTASPLTNDDLCDAITIPLSKYAFRSSSLHCNTVPGHNIGASGGGSNVNTTCGTLGNTSVWYKFETPSCTDLNSSSLNIILSTDNPGTDFNTLIRVFESSDNTCNGVMTEVACSYDGTPAGCIGSGAVGSSNLNVSTMLNAGETYFVMVEGEGGSTGHFELSLAMETEAPTLVPGPFPETEVEVSWPDLGATDYHLFWGLSGSAGFSVSWDLQTTNKVMSYMQPGSTYDFWVGNSCDGTSYGLMWSPTAQITTAGNQCLTPDPLMCQFPPSDNSITFTWTDVPAADHYHIFYRRIGQAGHNIAWNVTGTSYTIPNLPSGQTYEIWMYSVCYGNMAIMSNPIYCITSAPNGAAAKGSEVMTNPDLEAIYSFHYDGIDFVNHKPSEIPFGLLVEQEGLTEVKIDGARLKQYNQSGEEITEYFMGSTIDLDIEVHPVLVDQQQSVLNISTTKDFEGTLSVLDLNGRLLQKADVSLHAGIVEQFNLDLGTMSSGTHLLVFQNDREVINKKIVIAGK